MDKENFVVYVKDLLEKNHIEHWLDCGNLLEYRRGDILQHNEVDCDFGVLLKDFYKILNICKTDTRISFKAIWYGEIAIYDAENPKFHIDFFCYSKKGRFLYLHDYVMNHFSNRHDLERNARFLQSEIFPLQTIQYYNSEFNAPKEIDIHLYRRYGDWTKPNHNWTWNDAENVCKDYRQFAIQTNPDKEILQWLTTKIPKEMYNVYFDNTYILTDEPFILFMHDTKCPITKMWQVLVMEENISDVISESSELISPLQTIKTKCQQSIDYDALDWKYTKTNRMIARYKSDSKKMAKIVQ